MLDQCSRNCHHSRTFPCTPQKAGSDRMHEHLLEIHFPSQFHLANCIKSLLIGGLSEETGCHFVSFWIHPNFIGSGQFIWLELEYSHSTTCKSVRSKCCLNADGVGRSFSPSAIFLLNRYHLADGNDIQGWSQKWKHSQMSLIYNKLLKVWASRRAAGVDKMVGSKL